MMLALPSLSSALQIITPNEMCGQLTALYLFTMFAVGGGPGSTYLGFPTEYVWGDAMLLRYAIATAAAVQFPAALLVCWIGIKPLPRTHS